MTTQKTEWREISLEEIVTWMTNSQNIIADSYVANALQEGYLHKNFSFNEISVAQYERLRMKVLQEIELHGNSVGILESSDLQNNDTTVFE